MATTRYSIVLDDTHPNITYNGNWFQDSGSTDNRGYLGPTYRSSSHGTNDNSSLSFSFVGTRIRLFGSLNGDEAVSDILDPRWECAVDGQVISNGTNNAQQPPQNNILLCEDNSVSDGRHEITLTVNNKSPNTFWFDKVEYLPSPSVNIDNEVTLIDSSDPGLQAALGRGWTSLGDVSNMTTSADSEFSYKFRGVSLTWFAFIPVEMSGTPTLGSYSIDGAPETDFRLRGFPANTRFTQFNQKIFETTPVAPGEHTLVVKYKGTGRETPLALDYIMVQNAPEASQPPQPPPTDGGGNNGGGNNGGGGNGNGNSGGGNNDGGNGGGGGGSSGGQTGDGQSVEGSSNIGAIVGGVVGGLAVILLLLALFWFLRRRRRRKMEEEDAQDATSPDLFFPVEPYREPHPYSTSQSQIQTQTQTQFTSPSEYSSYNPYHARNPSSSAVTNSNSLPSEMAEQPRTVSPISSFNSQPQPLAPLRLHGYIPSSKEAQSVGPLTNRSAGESLPSGSMSAPSDSMTNSSSGRRVIMHEDSGVRMPRVERESVVELPPQYTAS